MPKTVSGEEFEIKSGCCLLFDLRDKIMRLFPGLRSQKGDAMVWDDDDSLYVGTANEHLCIVIAEAIANTHNLSRVVRVRQAEVHDFFRVFVLKE